MSEYSIEEINAVFSGENDRLTCKELREKLQRPKFQPEVEQAVVMAYKEFPTVHKLGYWSDGLEDRVSLVRSLTLTEHGPDVRAYVEGMKRLADAYEIFNPNKDGLTDVKKVQEFATLVLKDHPIED